MDLYINPPLDPAREKPGASGEGGSPGRLARQLAWAIGWGTKGGLAIADQALFAGAQFVLNILLARWLSPTGYGTFAAVYSLFILVSAVHSALLVEPMIVFGSGRHLRNRASYLGIVLRGHWLLTAPAGVLLFGSGLVLAGLHLPSVGYALSALGLALPLILLAWFTRRAFYIELRPGRAAAGGAVYFGGLVALIGWSHAAGTLTPVTAVLAMGAAALPAAGLHLAWLRPRLSPSPGLNSREVVAEHWGYGRWALAAALAGWVSWNVYFLILPIWFGLGTAGALKALLNLVNPANHSLMALGMLALPLLVRHLKQGGFPLMRQSVRRIGLALFAGSTLYLLALWFFRVRIIHLLYAGKYIDYSGLPILVAALAPLAGAWNVTLESSLRACVRPDRVFWGYLATGAVALSLGLWLTATWEVAGALGGILLSNVGLTATLWLFYRKARREAATA